MIIEFLTPRALFAKVAATHHEGKPVVSPVWYKWDVGSYLVVGNERTNHVRNPRGDRRCGVMVKNQTLPYKRVSVLGVAEFFPDYFDWQTPARRMVLRDLGEEGMSYSDPNFRFPRVSIRVWPETLSTWNGGGFDRTLQRNTMWHKYDLPAGVDV